MMADWKKNKLKFQMPHDRVERCMRCVKADKRAEAIRREAFDKLLLERWKVRQVAKNGAPGSSRPTDKVKQSDKVKCDETIQRA